MVVFGVFKNRLFFGWIPPRFNRALNGILDRAVFAACPGFVIF
jgi:hypothetical protein